YSKQYNGIIIRISMMFLVFILCIKLSLVLIRAVNQYVYELFVITKAIFIASNSCGYIRNRTL
ncbi:hypothetical protein, partial [Aquimarina algiphila]|uniref:hypothetical protein n=1 Tax=Aquimarina algiphila TaxID=2047982 RepID=UPI001ABFE5CE